MLKQISQLGFPSILVKVLLQVSPRTSADFAHE